MTELVWSNGAPRSVAFDDIYFSAGGGLEESRTVFLEGCGLPQAWGGRDRFVVGELGFGTGLNILALLALWRRERPSPRARLHLFSVEAHPLALDDARRALSGWPELAADAERLLAQWPRGRRGLHRIGWPDCGASLDLAILDVAEALDGWTGRADAWLLDGFAPARNPAMWSEAVLRAVAARSIPGARAATFTVAGGVRRGLEAAGFTLARRPGHGAKRERLEARLDRGAPAPPCGLPLGSHVAVVGGGIAGAALVRALRAEGLVPILVEAQALGAGASGNPAALATPRLDAGLGPQARLHAQAFARAVALIDAEAPAAILGLGALQLAAGPRDAARFARVADWNGLDPGAAILESPAAVAAALREPQAPAGLMLSEARVVEPLAVLAAWVAEAPRIVGEVATLVRDGDRWRLLAADGGLIAEADAVCLAVGAALPAFLPKTRLRRVRGQVEIVSGKELGGPAAAWGGYAIPARGGVLYGATHTRDDSGTEPREADSQANHASLRARRPGLAARLEGVPATSRAAVRLAAPDHTPLAGGAPGLPGVHVLGALGGRGFTLAPLLAEHVAATLVGAPSPLTGEAQALVDPRRARIAAE